MRKSILIAAGVLSVLSFNHAIAKKAVHHRHPGQTQSPMVYHSNSYGWGTGYRYDWQAGDCDITNKTSLNTCTNGGR